MKRKRLLPILFFLIICYNSFPQDFQISSSRVEYDGYRLSVSYDIYSRNQSDIFFILVEILKENGTPVRAESFKGDVGDSITPGRNKNIIWVPEDDAIFLDDTVTVEIKGEKYERSFSRGSVLMRSAVLPGLGQTKISNGKPWWLAGIAAYGSLAGGFIFHNNYQKAFDSYKVETDPIERADLYDQSQKDKKLSSALFVSAAALWVGNLVWAAAAPNEYRALQLPEFTVYSSPGNQGMITVLSFTLDF